MVYKVGRRLFTQVLGRGVPGSPYPGYCIEITFSKAARENDRRAAGAGRQSVHVVGWVKMRRGMLGTEGCGKMRESQNTQFLELRFRALLDEGTSEIQLALS